MIHQYAFQPPQRVLTGPGALKNVASQLEKLGKRRALILTGNSLATKTELVGELEELLRGSHAGTFSGCKQHVLSRSVDEAVEHAREVNADALISFGGGSPIDTAKNVAYRLLGDAPREAMPQIAIPTTLSAGEFTAMAGITDEATRIKSGVGDSRLLPMVVIHDPEVTVETPAQLWVSTGVKALDHALEALWSARAHPVTDTLALEAIRRLRANLLDSVDPERIEARLQCMIAAWMSIFGVRNVGMRLSHPLGHQIGARWDIPHGVTSCIVLPEVMRFLAPSTSDAQARIAEAFGSDTNGSNPESAAESVEELIRSLEVPTKLSEAGAVREELPDVARAVAHELSAARSPDAGTATEEVLLELLERVW
ncbi:MAG: iron-containing alcohol dehydrogenase [Candidatus Hydrogenedentes bacterium]|nr:iron-containing alcohol dehydrogenase [Candidatus Hydrogenedentota bacterium]